MRIDLFGDQVESIRRFDVESQRSVLKVEECTLLPLTEYQKSRNASGASLHDLMREADIPGRDLPPPGEPFPGLGTGGADAPAAQRVGLLACSNGRS